MTGEVRISIGGGRIYAYALMAVVSLAMGLGCMGGQTGYTVYVQNPPTTTTEATARGAPGDKGGLVVTQATEPTTVGYAPQVDFSQVSVSVAGCDDDYYMNAMVAGYATNNGSNVLSSVPIVTQLQTSEGAVVSGGEKTTVLTNLSPGETRSFSIIYEAPPQWKRCRASVNGDWQT